MSDDLSLAVRFLQLPFRLQHAIADRAGLNFTDYYNDEAVATELFRRAGRDHDLLVRIWLEVAAAEEGRKETPPVCTVDAQQCDAECQARPDRKCAPGSTPTETMYKLARKASFFWPNMGDHLTERENVLAALDTGEAAEKRAEEAEARVRELEKALHVALEIMSSPVVLPAGHSGDEETGQHDEDCSRCLLESAIEQAENALRFMIGPLDPPKEG